MRAHWIFALSVMLAPAPAFAQSGPPEALQQVYACATVSGETERLACYDQAVRTLQQAETQGRIVAVDREQVQEFERESFGFSLPSMSRIFNRSEAANQTERIDRVEMQVQRIVRHADRRHSFIMTNGQTWTQIEPQSATNVDPGDTIAIRRASLGSFMLSPENGRAHRVRRSE